MTDKHDKHSRTDLDPFLLFFAKIAINGEKSNSKAVPTIGQGRTGDSFIFIHQFPNFGDQVTEIGFSLQIKFLTYF